MFLVDLTGFLIGLILLLMLVVSVTIFAVAMWKEYQGEYFSVRELMDDTGKVIKSFIASVAQLFSKNKKKVSHKAKKSSAAASKSKALPQSEPGRNLANVYRPRQLMTGEEVAQFRKLQRWANRKNYLVFAKVRLSDLIESKVDPNVSKKPAMLIQSKCVDFVVCDQAMEVKCIVLLSKTNQRMQLNRFISDALTSCGYKVLVTEAIDDRDLNAL